MAARIDDIPAEFYIANQAACLLQPLIHEAWVNETFLMSNRMALSSKALKRRAIDGHLLLSDEKQMLSWRSHFSSVLNHHLPEHVPPYTEHQPQIRTNTRISSHAPNIAEIIDAIKALPSNKAERIDGIPAQFFKANQDQAACLLQSLIHEAWDNESFPSEWLYHQNS